MSDTLFSLPDDAPDRLTRARIAMERAEADLERAEAACDELPIGIERQRNAVAAARYELHLAEQERLNR